jgi:hypothetical protein
MPGEQVKDLEGTGPTLYEDTGPVFKKVTTSLRTEGTQAELRCKLTVLPIHATKIYRAVHTSKLLLQAPHLLNG